LRRRGTIWPLPRLLKRRRWQVGLALPGPGEKDARPHFMYARRKSWGRAMLDWDSFSKPIIALWPWPGSKEFLESEFFASFFGAMVGGGLAYVAANRSEKLKAIQTEIAGCNAAIALSHSIINTAVTLKGQHIKPLLERYEKEFHDYAFAMDYAQRMNGQFAYTVLLEMRNISKPFMPGEDLQEVVIERIVGSGRAQLLGAQVRQCVESLRESIDNRNMIVAKLDGKPLQEVLPIYFGMRNEAGRVDERFCDYLTALGAHADDCIYFGMLLQEIVITHGQRMRKRLSRSAPKIMTFDYSIAEKRGLLPDRSLFNDFEKQFRPLPFPRLYRLGKKISDLLARWN